MWFLMLATVYLAVFGLRLDAGYWGGITVPGNLLALAGISAFAFGTARLTTTTKSARSPGTKKLLPPEEERQLKRRKMLLQLFTNDDGLFDLGDTQMIALGAVTGAVYLGIVFSFLEHVSQSAQISLPQVDDTLLGGTAVSHGAYLFKKIGSRPGQG